MSQAWQSGDRASVPGGTRNEPRLAITRATYYHLHLACITRRISQQQPAQHSKAPRLVSPARTSDNHQRRTRHTETKRPRTTKATGPSNEDTMPRNAAKPLKSRSPKRQTYAECVIHGRERQRRKPTDCDCHFISEYMWLTLSSAGMQILSA
ncbi:hypothetical protein Hypma_005424, partial [Hypsizygus marmoreus]